MPPFSVLRSVSDFNRACGLLALALVGASASLPAAPPPPSTAAVSAVAGAALAKAKTAAEETPLSLPGAETFVYRTVEDISVRLHVFKPAGWRPGDRRSALVYFFGGGWTHGTPLQAAGWARWAAARGMVGMAPDYRVKNRAGTSPLEAVSDGRAALRWVEDLAIELGIDRSRIAVAGSSAGGHLALWTAISHTPPGSDPSLAPTVKPAALILLSAVSDTSVATGYTPARFGENATALSPVHQLDPRMPPMLVFHGDADQTVPQAQSLALRDKLLSTANVCEFVNVPGGAHSFTSQPGWREKSESLAEGFLKEQGLLPAQPHS